MQVIKTNLKEIFIELVKNSKEKIYLSSPFIKENIAKLIVENKKDGVDCKILTKFTLPNIRSGGLDLESIQYFTGKDFSVKNISNLHAKIFIFDNNIIITSANLTNGGFFKNLEYGVLFQNNSEIEKDFLNFYFDKNHNLVEEKHILKIKEIISKLPKIDKKEENLSLDENDIFLEDISLVKKSLSKGNLLTYECINKIGKNIFKTKDIYKYENLFKGKTPKNTIRRNLQELRDNGLLEFIEKGVYKKLWL
ncbi:MAG: phospholipase D-like domain-containing protein [Candidatus Gracilibacteria bacterium]|nr:phospholipase D-like domain-containing protein [Candidatus Gracilibacteria bacterium]